MVDSQQQRPPATRDDRFRHESKRRRRGRPDRSTQRLNEGPSRRRLPLRAKIVYSSPKRDDGVIRIPEAVLKDLEDPFEGRRQVQFNAPFRRFRITYIRL